MFYICYRLIFNIASLVTFVNTICDSLVTLVTTSFFFCRKLISHYYILSFRVLISITAHILWIRFLQTQRTVTGFSLIFNLSWIRFLSLIFLICSLLTDSLFLTALLLEYLRARVYFTFIKMS